jgi:ATP-dependent Clp protease ATP-binding subunit ClpC
MTSNVGAPTLKKTLGFGSGDEESSYEMMKKKLLGDLKKVFRPEFLNRIDETIVFRSLTREELKQIVDLMLEEVRERLAEKKLKLEVGPRAKEFFIDKGYDPSFGARPLRRAIQRYLENPLAEEILKGNLKEGTTIKVGMKDGKLNFK